MPTPISITPQQLRWFRMKRSGLVTPFATPEEAASALFGIQAQIEPSAGLALWNRTTGLTHAQFEQLIYQQRTLVKLWGQRHTLHLYASSDWPLLHAVRSINKTWWERQADKEAINGLAEGAISLAAHHEMLEVVAEALRQRATMGRRELRAVLEAARLPINEEWFSPWGGLFAQLVRLGYACHAGRIDGEGHFAHRQVWLPDLAWHSIDPNAANLTILRRYFAAYGPATIQDFNYWRSPSGNHAKRWLAQIQPKLSEVEVSGKTMWVLKGDLDELSTSTPEAEGWPIRMLHRFEPYLLAHKEKDWVVDAAHYNQIWRPAGHIEGIVLVYGRAAATWRYERKGKGIEIVVTPFGSLPRAVSEAIPTMAAQVAHFFDLSLSDLRITSS